MSRNIFFGGPDRDDLDVIDTHAPVEECGRLGLVDRHHPSLLWPAFRVGELDSRLYHLSSPV